MSFTYDEVCTALSGFVAAPETAVDYKVGDKEVRNSQKSKLLLDQAKFLAQYPLGDFETVSIDISDVNEFGQDFTQRSVPQ